MLFLQFRAVILMCVTRVVASADEFSCFNYTEAKISSTNLPETFLVSVEFVDQLKNYSADLSEFYDQKLNISSLKSDHDGLSYDVIFNRTSNFFAFVNKTSENDQSCDVSQLSGSSLPGDVFFFPSDAVKLNRSILGVVDLFELFWKSTGLSVDKSSSDDGRRTPPVQRLVGCTKVSDNKIWLEIKVRMSDKNFTFNNVKKSQPVPTRMEVKVYENKAQNPKVYFDGVYEIFGYKTTLEKEEENYLLPPVGVYCAGTPATKPAPDLPMDFSVEIEYVDHNKKIIDADEVYCDCKNQMLGLEFSQISSDEPATIGSIDNLIPGHYRLIQDFNTGFQYILDSFSSRCIQVTSIPGHAGSIKLAGPHQRLIGMKKPFELLFVLEATNYTYVGKRYEYGVPLDVWQAFELKKTKDTQQKELVEKIVYELWVSNDNWTYSGFRSWTPNLPVYFKVYRSDNYGRKNFTVQKFHNYVTYDESRGTDWPKLDVFTCLSQVATDFFMVELNDTLSNLKNIGLDLVTRRMREIIGKHANVSILRIGDFHVFAQDNDDKLRANVSFGIAEKLAQIGAKTEFYQPEIDAKSAVGKLNESVLSGDLIFDVISLNGSKKAFAVRKATLSRLVHFDGKSIVVNVKKGYTGGSMATMSFFMLIIGGVCGVLLAYVYVKRTRGGIAYQIYE